MELNYNDKQDLLKRFPDFELSYETVSHKKVSDDHNLGMAISIGKKYFAWYTFSGSRDVCYLMELNKDKKITKVCEVQTLFHPCLSIGTVFYGTLNEHLLENTPDASATPLHSVFIVEDVYYYKGFPTKQLCFGEKIGFLKECFERYIVQQFDEPSTFKPPHNQPSPSHLVVFALPVMWIIDSHTRNTQRLDCLPERITKTIGYVTHHIQYRSLYKISPYLNVYMNTGIHANPVQSINTSSSNSNSISINTPMTVAPNTRNAEQTVSCTHTQAAAKPPNPLSLIPEKPHYMDFNKPQYRHPAVFLIRADRQYDIYHLYAFGKNKVPVYYNVAYIPNYRTSVFMNALFRNIRENTNLDYIEESDDETDFEDIREDKYVDLQKTLYMECTFQPKFKKWVPIRVVDAYDRVVHISKL